MAKTQIKNYVFKPGVGADDSYYPNAHSLLERNKDFLLSESIAYINQEIEDATKCKRDIGYIVDGAQWDMVLGTNYNAVFLGIAEYNSADISKTVLRTIARTKTELAGYIDTTSATRTDAFFDEVLDIAENGRAYADPLTYNVPPTANVALVGAAQRLINNTSFIQAEVNAWVDVNYPAHDHDVDKCSRDIKYAINALIYDLLYGGNSATYDSAKFFFYAFADGSPGIDPTHKAQTVAAYNRLQSIAQDIILGNAVTKSAGNLLSQDTSGNSGTSTEATTVSTLVQIIEDVIDAGSQASAQAVLDGLTRTVPVITWADSNYQTAFADITTAKTDIIDAVTWDENYTYNQAKCQRDLGYVLDAYVKDLRYGGNEYLKNVIKYYWDGSVAQVDGNRIPEIDTHAFIGDLIKDYIFTNTAWDAQGFISQHIDTSKVQESFTFTPTGGEYIPETGELTLTIGSHSLGRGVPIYIATNSITFTCGLDNHATTHSYPRASGVPNDTGTDPYYNKAVYITAATDTTITVNIGISSDTSQHIFYGATANCITTSANNAMNELVTATVDVITNGLDSMPTLVRTGVGQVRVQGRYANEELLLITNTTKNEIIYNFSSPSQGATAELKTDGVIVDEDFPKYLQTTDAVTTITLKYDTRTHSATDSLQIFAEKVENGKSVVTTRPFDFGTDAIERSRSANPLSMLDADFEYGLQPTKWAAISTLRGYPSIYEIPGTDTSVVSVTTDASAGTEGVGQSLITVETVTSHGFQVGQPVTVKAFEDSISGAARAEGSFLINSIPTDRTFTYYAKSKVGTVEGQLLSTTYTQLREGGFYTGAELGNPTFTVSSNGSSGTLSLQLNVEAGSTIIPFDGTAPEIGAPLINGNIPTGSQVTAIRSTSAGGGVYVTPVIASETLTGFRDVEVEDSAGLLVGLSADRGDGYATNIEEINGNIVTFDSAFTVDLVPNSKSYTGISGTNVSPQGADASFTINTSGDSSNTYLLTSVDNPGSGYEVGDRIIIDGEDLGGLSEINDATILVTEIGSGGLIIAGDITGEAFTGIATVEGAVGTVSGGVGADAQFDLTWNNGTYLTADISSPDFSASYEVNDRIKILGSAADPVNGVDGVNDVYLTVTGIGAGGAITSVNIDSGLAPDNFVTYNGVPWTTSGIGTNALFNIELQSGSYLVTIDFSGQDFLPGDTVTFLGTNLGGTSPANDLVITVTNVDTNGEILTFATTTGGDSAYNGGSRSLVPSTIIVGSGATFDVDLTEGVYGVTIVNPGQDYGVGQTITILGTDLLGETPTNDLVLTIGSTTGFTDGGITSVSDSGTAAQNTGPFVGVAGTNDLPIGSGFEINVDRESKQYINFFLSNSGTDYKVGDRILINGEDLDGVSPLNDIEIYIAGVDPTGSVTNYNQSWIAASEGTILDLYSSVTMTEATTSELLFDDTVDFESLATVEVEFPSAHGLVPGNTFIVAVSSDDGTNSHNLINGSYFATDIPDIFTLSFQVRAPGPIDDITSAVVGIVVPRPDSFFIHRPYDGGVQLGTGGPQHGAQAIRQSKKYIRYQSGKGIMYTTGALFAPSYDLRSVEAEGVEVGSIITITTDDNDHGVQVGGIIRLLGIETPGYNSGPETRTPPQFDYEVIEVVNERIFKVRAQRRLGSTSAVLGFAAQMSVVSWHGATVRSGIFDDQNGIFWEYDGTQISVVQRTGTKQLAGTISMAVDSNVVAGTNTRFIDQLKAGDRIIVKGMTHVVSHVINQEEITVTPDWRGTVNIAGAKANLIFDKKTKQENFNLDRLDGTGPSGYDLDVAKMQMIGIQYSWYGAGFIDFMLRGQDGNFIFAHRMRNSNINTEAFMRSGNLPVRYEVTNEGPPGRLAEDMDDTQTTMVLEDSSFFPTSGTVYVNNEIITFTGNNEATNTLTGCSRAAAFENFQAGATRQYTAGAATSHSARTGIILISQTITPLISHWGSAFITDGGFDEDRGYIFSYPETSIDISTIKQTAFMIRLAPSVSNALVGDLGERELLNRAQLLLQGIEITSDTGDGKGIVIEGVLNPQNFPENPDFVQWSELTSTAQGGQPSFAQIAAGGAITWTSGASATTATPTVAAFPSGTITLSDIPWRGGTQYTLNNWDYVMVTEANYQSYRNQGMSEGDYFTHPGFPSGTRIRSWGGTYRRDGITYRYIRLDDDATSTDTSNNTATVEQQWRTSSTSTIWFEQSSFESSNVSEGTSVSDSIFPAGTLVNTVAKQEYFGTTYYRVSFNNTSDGSTLTPGSSTVEFTFEEPPYAQPGETVFSFIATPGERSTLSLAELKELTNTPLGGRGTYPNGPDVLAINVYKVAGTNINGNIILRWGEAQA
jgi:hypothetical protein